MNCVMGPPAIADSMLYLFQPFGDAPDVRAEEQDKTRGKRNAYNLTAWYRGEEVVCTNYTKEDDTFRCAFDLKADWPGTLSISIQGSSSNIQPVCIDNEEPKLYEFLIKPDPPSIVNITKNNNGVKLQWTPSIFKRTCYAVNISNNEFSTTEIYRTVTEASIPLQPKLCHTFRVKAISFSLSGNCTKGLWSDWSKAVEWGEENLYDNSMFSVLLYILIPLCVAILTIIVLIYLKRIKLLILPTIPEPGKFVKQLFEEHSEDLQKPPPEDPIKDEQTHLLVFVQTSGNEN
ncbi:interleukin-13 receptor subunit alpha-1-like [Rhineura floridana]|uniref:interleukin-13 receptor subunit alpha-1-like n=1 Tax=Rhineura floridana TaxID=261503 RepID=UPI002AC83DB1|nr:interleukin-13 receptor subunit alpha-1-like [Rhineura floridana]